MSRGDPRTRRGMLAAGGACLAGLAGCLGLGGGNTPGADGTPADGTPTDADEAAGTPTSSPTPTAAPSPGPEPNTGVGMGCHTGKSDYFFVPEVTWIEVGGAVAWSVQSQCKQRVAAYHPDNDAPLRIPEAAEPWQSPVLVSGHATSFEHTFEVEGVYDCRGLYEKFGQAGTVIVGRPDPEGQPGLAPPQESIPEPARKQLRALNERVRELLA